MAGPLKLRAEDAEDVVVLSSVLQDALLPLAELAYLPAERRLAFVAARFCWERLDDASPAAKRVYERIKCGVTFETVTAVKSRGFDPAARDRMLELLALRVDGGAVDLLCAGGAAIRLEVERVLAHAQDIGEAWPTRWRPNHPGLDPESDAKPM